MKVGTDSVILGSWAMLPGAEGARVLDIGAGSGVLSLMAAQRAPGAKITAVEIDRSASDACRHNVAASPWSDRIEVINADVNGLLPEVGQFDAIVSNPPFFKEALHAPDERRSLARHGDSFDVVALLEMSRQLLAPDGVVSFIAPPNRHDDIMWHGTLARLNLLDMVRLSHSSRRPPVRHLYTFTPGHAPRRAVTDMTVGDELYRRLTSPFYLDQ